MNNESHIFGLKYYFPRIRVDDKMILYHRDIEKPILNRQLNPVNITQDSKKGPHIILFTDPHSLQFVKQLELVQKNGYEIIFGTPVDTDDGKLYKIKGRFDPTFYSGQFQNAIKELRLEKAIIEYLPPDGNEILKTSVDYIQFHLHANDTVINIPSDPPKNAKA